MDRRKTEINLAALLDNELRDDNRVATLQDLLGSDSALRAEFEDQQLVKEAVGSLENYEAPSFMTTRVLGEIAERRKAQQRQPRWRPWAALLGGAAALIAGFASTLGLLAPRAMQAGQLMADGAGRESASVMLPAGLSQNMEYSPQFWADVSMPDGESSPELRDFIRFANEAHNYRKLSRSTASSSPNMTEAVLALSSDEQPQFVWASQGR